MPTSFSMLMEWTRNLMHTIQSAQLAFWMAQYPQQPCVPQWMQRLQKVYLDLQLWQYCKMFSATKIMFFQSLWNNPILLLQVGFHLPLVIYHIDQLICFMSCFSLYSNWLKFQLELLGFPLVGLWYLKVHLHLCYAWPIDPHNFCLWVPQSSCMVCMVCIIHIA